MPHFFTGGMSFDCCVLLVEAICQLARFSYIFPFELNSLVSLAMGVLTIEVFD